MQRNADIGLFTKPPSLIAWQKIDFVCFIQTWHYPIIIEIPDWLLPRASAQPPKAVI